MLFIVMCKSVDFRMVCGSLRGCQLYVLAPPYGVPAGPPSASFSGIWTLSGQIGSGLISRLIMIQAKLKR